MGLFLNEVCKVRKDAIGGDDKSYTLAIVKRTYKKSMRIVLVNSDMSLGKEHTVKPETLWKMKAAARKSVTRRVESASAKSANVAAPKAAPECAMFEHMTPPVGGMQNLNVTTLLKIVGKSTLFGIAEDSVLKFNGNAIVNAANEGCVDGGGIDGAINTAGGDELMKARRELPVINEGEYGRRIRCPTGDAKITIAGLLDCEYVIHAVGPNFSFEDSEADALLKLKNAYKNSLLRASEAKLRSVAFCIISGGIFRGQCPLAKIMETALFAIAENAYPGLEHVYFCGFTEYERHVLSEVVQKPPSGLLSIVDPCIK